MLCCVDLIDACLPKCTSQFLDRKDNNRTGQDLLQFVVRCPLFAGSIDREVSFLG